MNIEQLPIDLLYSKFQNIHERGVINFNSYSSIKKELLKLCHNFSNELKYIIKNLDNINHLRTIKFSKKVIDQTYCYLLPALCELNLFWKTQSTIFFFDKEIALNILQHSNIELSNNEKEYINHMLIVEINTPYDHHKIDILEKNDVINKYLLFRGKHFYRRSIQFFMEWNTIKNK